MRDSQCAMITDIGEDTGVRPTPSFAVHANIYKISPSTAVPTIVKCSLLLWQYENGYYAVSN